MTALAAVLIAAATPSPPLHAQDAQHQSQQSKQQSQHQSQQQSPQQQAQHQQNQTGRTQDEQHADAIPILPARDIVGRAVMDPHGRDAGRVDSLVIDIRNGVVEYVLIAGQGDFDLNGQLVAVPWSAIQRPRGRGAVGVKIAADQLTQAPRIASNAIYQLNSPGWRSRIYGYYNYPYPYYAGAAGARAVTPGGQVQTQGRAQPPATGESAAQSARGQPQAQQTQTEAKAQNGGANRSGGTQAQQQQNKPGGNEQASQAQNGPPGLAIGREGIVSALRSPTSVSPQGLRSAQVYAQNGDVMGRIDQVLVDTRHGNVAYVLLERGGFLGLDPTWFALPVEALSWSPYNANYGYRLTVDEQLLDNVPPVPANEAHLTTYVPKHDLAQLYEHFGIKPYWTSGAAQSAPPSTSGQGAGSGK